MAVETKSDSRVPLVLSADGVCVVIDLAAGVPRVLHWGPPADTADERFLETLSQAQHGADELTGADHLPPVVPEPSGGWMGTPGLDGHRDGTAFTTRFAVTDYELEGDAATGQTVRVHSADEAVGLALTTTIELTSSGLLRLRARVTNNAESEYTVDGVRLVVPVPAEAQELLDFTGRHLRERSPQRRPFTAGTHLREGRRGRTGSDAAFAIVAGTPHFGFRSGEVWAVHTAWSGNHATFAELGLTGVRVLGGGELLMPGEVVLEPGEAYTTPWLYGAYGHGLDAVAESFHRYLRGRDSHPTTPRAVVLNTWEAVYFDHDLEALVKLAELGADVGVERFVLDDGWFLARRHDRAGLGDWQVDPDVWPEGLKPLVDEVRRLGMQFGLWVEPEMINEDSELARTHPEWILGPGQRLPLSGRSQQVLNLTIPAAFDHVLESLSTVIGQYAIDYLKWDHNRDLLEAGDRVGGRARVHAQTLAAYALMDELKRRYPGLEIESCSSGGGRVDLEALHHTDRVWASDCIDALERQRIQRWTGLLLPPELVGSHVGAAISHTTHRQHSLAFRAATALFAHFGMELDLRDLPPTDLDELTEWIALYKGERELLHSGITVNCDYPDETYWARGVVAPHGQRALFSLVAMDTMQATQPGRIRVPGLDRSTRYRIEPIELSARALVRTRSGPPWWWTRPDVVSGLTLETVGLAGPMLYPEQALLFRLVAVSSEEGERTWHE